MRLRQYLDEHGLSPSDFAERIGVSFQAVYRYLDGERIPAHDVLARIYKETKGRVTSNDFHCHEPAA
jgi:transcriptional regulator with XRE-family HTH domain